MATAAAPDDIKVIVTDRPGSPEGVVKTPAGEPNIMAVKWGIWKQVGVRCARSFFQNFLGFILGAGFGTGVAHAAEAIAAQAGMPVPPELGSMLRVLLGAFFASIMPTVVCFVQNTLEILTELDATNPKLRA